MNNIEQYFLSVLGCAIRAETPPPPPDDVDWNALYHLAERHQLAGTLGGVLAELPGVPPEAASRFTNAYYTDIYQDSIRQAEAEQLYHTLSAHGIAYAPFKGVVVRQLYPPQVIRTMNDVDILVKPEDMEQARAALPEAGYRFVCEKSIHAIYAKEPGTLVEIHSAILSHWSKYYAFYNDIWERMIPSPEDPCRYEMSEDYIYLTALLHYEKHLTNKGAAVQHLLDLYVLADIRGITSKRESIAASLCSLGLLVFAQNAEALAHAWFTGEALTKKQAQLGQYILSSGKGDYALHADYQKQYVDRKSTFAAHSSLLPSGEEMAKLFPGLGSKPKLYPLCWVLYILRGAKHALERCIKTMIRLWLRLTGKTDWVGLYKEAHKKSWGSRI